MPFSEQYLRQVALLIDAMPFVAAERDFALKGGTAINLFMRDMPRLSVDIDLTWLPIAGRPESLAAIDASMKRMAVSLSEGLRGARILEVPNAREPTVTKLTIQRLDARIKIEVTPVLRGCVFGPETRSVSRTVEDTFGYAQTQVVSFADLYAGKIVAALDRQHPRDLFDVRDLLASEGISDDLRRAFLVYLVSHDRPMAEVLAPRRKNITQNFAQGFEGMTLEPVPLVELETAREALIDSITGGMPDAHRRFLMGFERGEPDWELISLPEAADLPAVKWRRLNLDKLSAASRARLVDQLAAAMERGGAPREN